MIMCRSTGSLFRCKKQPQEHHLWSILLTLMFSEREILHAPPVGKRNFTPSRNTLIAHDRGYNIEQHHFDQGKINN
jgi:hypothetical protein